MADAVASDGPVERLAVVVGVGFCALEYLESQFQQVLDKPSKVNPLAIPLTMTNSLAAHLALAHSAHGPAHTLATACASGADAVGYGAQLLELDRADRVLVVGADAMLTRGALTFFTRMGALSQEIDNLTIASRPFDRDRDGFVAAEGAAAVVLQRTAGRSRGAIMGTGSSCDAVHIAAPDDTGAGAELAVEAALISAGLEAADVASINCHGTSTLLNDAAESELALRVFGSRVPLTSTKGTTGHMIGASGVAEIIVSAKTAETGMVPPVAGTANPISESVVTGEPRQLQPGHLVLSNSFGFGGHNSAVIVGPPGLAMRQTQ